MLTWSHRRLDPEIPAARAQPDKGRFKWPGCRAEEGRPAPLASSRWAGGRASLPQPRGEGRGAGEEGQRTGPRGSQHPHALSGGPWGEALAGHDPSWLVVLRPQWPLQSAGLLTSRACMQELGGQEKVSAWPREPDGPGPSCVSLDTGLDLSGS